jgi:type II secretory pathway pseudopilin PulG
MTTNRPHRNPVWHAGRRRGAAGHPLAFTLIELLIVISIIMILAVATLKVMQPLGERRVREAGRAVNVYISSARNRAMEIGRPCGVIFRRANGANSPTASMVLDQCEVPPPFAGDKTNAVVMVQDWTYRPDAWPYWDNDTTNPPPVLKTYVLKVQVRIGDFPPLLLKYGDLIQLNGQGPFYTIVRDPGNPIDPDYRRTTPTDPAMDPPSDPVVLDFPIDTTHGDYIFFDDTGVTIKDNNGDGYIDTHYLTLALNIQNLPMQAVSWPEYRVPTPPGNWSNPVSFQILRQPVKSAVSSLQLPAGSVVDLDFSGTDYQSFYQSAPTPPNKYYDVSIIFSSNGSVEGYYWNNKPYPVLGPIFMLIGSRSRVRDFVAQPLGTTPNLNDLPNWADLASTWITINNQTGMVATDENSAINFATEKDPMTNQVIPWDKMIAPIGYNNWAYFIYLSRTYARQSQSMGGR